MELIKNKTGLIMIAFLFVVSIENCKTSDEETPPVPLDGRGGGVIAFYSERGGKAEIYIMNADGSAETRLTNNDDEDLTPDLSPGGAYIVFISDRDGSRDIYRMNRDGSNVIRLTSTAAEDAYPYYSSDGSKIIYSSKPDGNWEICVMNSDGSDQRRLTYSSIHEEWAHISPDLHRIVYGAGNFPDSGDIYTMNIDGSDQKLLLDTANLLGLPKWSRTGEEIAFNNNTFLSGVFRGDVSIMHADGTNIRRLTDNNDTCVNEDPYWSPDNQRIVFQSNQSGNYQIYVINSDGSNRIRLTNHNGNDYWPCWSSLSE